MIRTAFVSFLLALATLGAAGARAEDVVRAEYSDWAPFTSAHVERGGLVVAIAAAAFKRAGFELAASEAPWPRVLADLKTGEADVALCQWYSLQNARTNILSDALVENRIVFVKRAADRWDYQGLDSLAGKRVAVIRGAYYETSFDRATFFAKDAAASLGGNLKKVAAGRDDLTVEDEIVARYAIGKDMPELKGQLGFSTSSLAVDTCHVAFSRASARGEELAKRFDMGLKAIKADGSYDEILKAFHVQ